MFPFYGHDRKSIGHSFLVISWRSTQTLVNPSRSRGGRSERERKIFFDRGWYYRFCWISLGCLIEVRFSVIWSKHIKETVSAIRPSSFRPFMSLYPWLILPFIFLFRAFATVLPQLPQGNYPEHQICRLCGRPCIMLFFFLPFRLVKDNILSRP
jgi:hypothetical protein